VQKFPVAEQVEELISRLMAYAAADESKQNVWDKIQVRKDCQKPESISLFSFEAEGQGNQKADY